MRLHRRRASNLVPARHASVAPLGDETLARIDSLNHAINRASSEISRRSTTQQAVQASSISACTALAGVVVAGHGDFRLLLLIPLLSAAFGLQWLDHHRAILRLGSYVAYVLEPQLQRCLDLEMPLWESFLRSQNRDGEGRRTWTLPIILLFYGTSLAALVLAAPGTYSIFRTGPVDSSFIAWAWPPGLFMTGLIFTLIGGGKMVHEMHRVRPSK